MVALDKSFNSLQTGRTFRTDKSDTGNQIYQVSIPFKREGLSEPFLFCSGIQRANVSIPFKREGLSEL